MIIEIPKKRLDKIDEIAIHHGFKFTEFPVSPTNINSFLHPEEKSVVIKNHDQINDIKSIEPAMIYYDRPIFINKKQAPNQKTHRSIGFDIIGISNGIAEAIILNTSIKILAEEGYKNIFIDINSTGDKNSVLRFNDELVCYYKKHSNILENQCSKNLTKKNFKLPDCGHECCRSVKSKAPRPLNFLSEESRNHFKEVLEYIEELEVPYRINDDLVVENNFYSKTIFEIKMEDNKGREIVLARGGRYDELANKIACKRNLVATGISMYFKKNKNERAYSDEIESPKILLIQFGFRAKMQSFRVIEILRQQKITIFQNLHKEKLSEQFDYAKELKIPYIIVIGFKEADEDEIIFKNINESYNDVVKINKLPQYLRKIRMV